jgi:hypothetical protein
VSLRVSSEPDYDSLLMLARAGTSLFEDNTTLSAFAGYGADQVEPPRAPPGRADVYPAAHWRALGGVSLSQILSPIWLASLGASAVHQQGSLSNPYRRATVRTSLFPEILPNSRDRFTAFLASSLYLGADTAVHARLGAYLDSWNVHSLIPELVVSKTIAEDFLLELQYRYYLQSRASFYQPVYPELEALMAGDQRLGRVAEQAGGLELEWQLLGRRASFGALRLLARGELSRLRYTQLPTEAIWARIVQLGALMSY